MILKWLDLFEHNLISFAKGYCTIPLSSQQNRKTNKYMMPLCLQCSLPPNIHDWDLMFLQLMQCSTSTVAGFMWKATMFPAKLRSVLLVIGFTFVPLLLKFILPVLLGFDNPKSELVSLGMPSHGQPASICTDFK